MTQRSQPDDTEVEILATKITSLQDQVSRLELKLAEVTDQRVTSNAIKVKKWQHESSLFSPARRSNVDSRSGNQRPILKTTSSTDGVRKRNVLSTTTLNAKQTMEQRKAAEKDDISLAFKAMEMRKRRVKCLDLGSGIEVELLHEMSTKMTVGYLEAQ